MPCFRQRFGGCLAPIQLRILRLFWPIARVDSAEKPDLLRCIRAESLKLKTERGEAHNFL
jgi:hypothetical protein